MASREGAAGEAQEEEEAAALPDLDHLTMRDFYDIYEVCVCGGCLLCVLVRAGSQTK